MVFDEFNFDESVPDPHRVGRDEIHKAKRLLEEAQLEAEVVQNKVTEASCRVGETMEEMAKIKSLMEASLEPADR